VGRLGGPSGPPWRGPCPVCLSEACLALAFFAGFKWGFPSCLRGPQGCPRHSSSSSSDDEYSEVPGEESPCCSRSRNSSLLCSRRSRRRILFSFLSAARSCSRRCAARARAQGVGGSDRATFTAITCRGRVELQITTMLHEPKDQRGVGTLLTSGPSGPW
jgi:hypothetical protein